MPIVLVLAYLEMLPRLDAQRSLDLVQAVRIGTSATLPIEDVKAIDRNLNRAANPNRKSKRARKATPEQLAGSGIGVRLVPVEPALRDG
jgi:hypothetical protein